MSSCSEVFGRDRITDNLFILFRFEESREEQARLHEELAQRERALRETQISCIHEVEELRGAQEMRMDESSRNELRESRATIQDLTSQVQELQERMNYTNVLKNVKI